MVAKVLKTAEFKKYIRNMFERQVMTGDLQYNRQSSIPLKLHLQENGQIGTNKLSQY